MSKERLVTKIEVKEFYNVQKATNFAHLVVTVADSDLNATDILDIAFIENMRCIKVAEGLRKMADKLEQIEK